jgi:hypothetical protein
LHTKQQHHFDGSTDLNLSQEVINAISEKKCGQFDRSVSNNFVSKGHRSNVERPVKSGFVYKGCLELLNNTGLSITLRMLSSGMGVFNLEQIKKFFCKFIAKFFTIATTEFNQTDRSIFQIAL